MPVKVALLCDEWMSSKGGISTVNRKLAIHLAKLHKDVEVSLFMSKCTKKERKLAGEYNIKVFKAKRDADPERWWMSPPSDFKTEVIIGHGAVLGKAAPYLRDHYRCKWIQFIHTDPEELGNYKEYPGASSAGENKHEKEVELCKKADLVVGIGAKLTEAFTAYLRPSKKVVSFTPGIFEEFLKVEQVEQAEQVSESRFRVLTFGRGDPEDVSLKGFDIAAQAIAHLKDESYILIFVGANDASRDKFKERLLSRGITANQLKVRRFKTGREKLADAFCEADVAIMPSRSEGFGLAALEALSAGLPILVSSNSGLAEALRVLPNGSSCVVTTEAGVNDTAVVKEWAKEIKKVREKSRDVRLKEAKDLRKKYKKKYSWLKESEALVKEMLALFPEHSDRGHAEDRYASANDERCVDPIPSKRRRVCTDVDDDDDEEEKEEEEKEEEEEEEENYCEDCKDNDDSDRNCDSLDQQNTSRASAAVIQLPAAVKIKPGVPQDTELDDLAGKIEPVWYQLGVRLGIDVDKLNQIRETKKDKPFEMLRHWKTTNVSSATYQLLYDALCHQRVGRCDLAKMFCCQTP